MALNQQEILALRGASLIKHFNDNRDLWKEIAKNAYSYAHQYVGSRPRVDDVILVLVPALEVAPALQSYLSGKKLGQKYWNTYFGDYILDQLWDELSRSPVEGGES